MALRWALTEPGQAPEHPRTKGQQAGAGLRDDPAPPAHSSGVSQDEPRADRRHNVVTGGSPCPIPLRDVPTSLSPILPLSLSCGQGQGPEFLHCTLLSPWSPLAPPLAPKLPKHPKTLMSPAQAQEVLQPFAYPVGPSRPAGQIGHLI